MRLIATGMLCAAVLVAVGCRQKEPAPESHNQTATNGGQPSEKSNLASRLDAATGMSNVSLKDEALATLAIEAARASDGDIAKKSIDAISNVVIHDVTAYNSALFLAKSGKAKDAVTIAQSINNVSQRDEALAKITKGETGN